MNISSTLNRGINSRHFGFLFLITLLCGLGILEIYLPHSYDYFSIADAAEEVSLLSTEEKPKLFTYYPFKSIEDFQEKLSLAVPREMKKRVDPVLPAMIFLCRKHKMNPLWVMSIMWTESHFRTRVKSGVGASGLMQIMPRTKHYLKETFIRNNYMFAHQNPKLYGYYKEELSDSDKQYREVLENMELGIFYLRLLLDQFQNLDHATIAYNMGPGWVSYRLKYQLPVGVRNRYLNKVKRTFHDLQSKLNLLTVQNDL